MTHTPYKQKNRTGENFRKKHKLKEQEESINLVTPEDMQTSDLPVIDSRYEVMELIGKGGMGAVYKIFDRELEKIFAIKLLQPELAKDQTALKRFEQEVEATCQLTHHNLAATYGHGKTPDGTPYLVMDYLAGENLSDLLAREGPLETERALKLASQICEALWHAHKNGVIHRDMKPTNVIVSKSEDGSETARLVDFGIAKILTSASRETHNLTETGAVFGSPHYMSPEHCLGFKMDERSDIYSLGCLMYEMLTGSTPFADTNAVQVVVKHINEEVQPFPAERKESKFGKKLEGVTLKCLEKDADRRYQSVEEIVKDLELIKEGKKPSKFVRHRSPRPEFTRRHIAAIAAGVSLLVMVIWQYAGMFDEHVYKMLVTGLIFTTCFSGSIAFLMLSIDQVKNLLSGKVSDRNCWRTVLVVSLAVTCFAYLDNAVSMCFDWSMRSMFGRLPEWVDVMIGLLPLMNKLAFGSAVVAAVGCLIFRSTKKTTVWHTGFQYVVLTTVLLIIASTSVPKQASGIARIVSGGRIMDTYAPWLSERLLNYSLLLDPRNQRSVINLARLQVLQGRHSDANETYENYFLREPLKNELAWAHFERAKSYDKPDDSQMRFTELTKAIKLAPRHEYYEDRAMIRWERGEIDDAMSDLYHATRCEPGAPMPYCKRALVLSSIGDYTTAITEQLDRMASAEATKQNPEVYFIRGLIYEHLYLPNEARIDFQRVIALTAASSDYRDLDLIDQLLMTAYAYKQIGDTSTYQKKMDELKVYSDLQERKDKMDKIFHRATLDLDW